MDRRSWTATRLAWLDVMGADPRISAQSFRVAYLLFGKFLDRRTGEAYPAQDTLAEVCGLKERALRNAIDQLSAGGYLEVRKGGWGHQNRYRMLITDRQENADQEDLLTGMDVPVNEGADRQKCADQGNTDRQIRAAPDRQKCAGESPSVNPFEGDSPPLPPSHRKNDASDAFEKFWKAYPRRVAKGTAEKAFAKIVRSGRVEIAEVIEGARRYAGERAGQEERFTKHPATWLNGQCWLDEPTGSPSRSPSGSPTASRTPAGGFTAMALEKYGAGR